MNKGLCEYCGREMIISVHNKRFCNTLCQRKHYNRRPEIREKGKIRMRRYRKNNPEWREKHRILQAKYKERRKAYQKQYFKKSEVRDKLSKRNKWRLKNDPKFAIANRIRRSLRHALAKYSDTGKIMTSKKYGIDWKEVIEHLKPFPKNIVNYEIDHIVPLRVFDLKNLEEVKKAFSPENLRWLTKFENRSKGGRYNLRQVE